MSWLKQNKILRYINSKISPKYRRYYTYYEQTLSHLEETSQKTVKEIKKIQLIRFNRILSLGWKIPGYQKYWKNFGFEKKELTDLFEITEIPVITKEYIKNNRSAFLPLTSKYRRTRTGGSTGTPFQIFEPKYQPRIELAFIHDAWSKYYPNISIETKATILKGTKLNDKWDYDPMKGLLLSTFQLSGETVKQFASLIEYYQTPILHAYPSSLYQFSKFLSAYDITIKHEFECICLSSEPLLDIQKNTIERVFKSPIVHWYGQGEKTVLATTQPSKTGFQVYPQYGYTEVLNNNNQHAEAGETGRIVGTSFWNTAMPLIRYHTSDLGIVDHYPGAGDSLYSFTLRNIVGRSLDFLLTKKKTLLPVTALNVTCAQFEEVKRVRFHQKEAGRVDLIIELMPNISNFDLGELKSSLQDLTHGLINIHPKTVKQLNPTRNGKHTYLNQELDLTDYLDNERS